ncbi:uncharacterized protein LOC114733769 [Neltuma alba]|uniref:uncharacterized protein LOC114733769 n=1 Tax=Neltuma alba TaxID=207710 RepID=UPI0010A4D354|nr:uncharacterized protein LOC114733769 [Prosopis alba]
MKRHEFKGAEEEDHDLLELSLSSSSSSKPNLLPSPPLSLSSQCPSFPSLPHPNFPSASSSSSPNLQYSYSTQDLAYPTTLFPPPLSTHPLFFNNPQLITEPAPLLPTTQPRLSLSANPGQRAGLCLQSRISRNPNRRPRGAKSETIPPPFPWATDRRAMVHSLRYLRDNQMLTITGIVQCRTCESSYEMGFDLEAKFAEVSTFITINKCNMYNRAPKVWLSPILPICKNCGNSVRPVVSEKKRSINWLFLFLGQMLGCCTLEQLKYYCKHTGNFRTGAKDRILYITYLGLREQLQPSGF